MIVILAIVTAAGMAAAIFLTVLKYKERQQRKRDAQYRDSQRSNLLAKKKPSSPARRSFEVGHEHQRDYIIQKSLASRAPTRESLPNESLPSEPLPSESLPSDEDQIEARQNSEEEEEAPTGPQKSPLLQDWKEFEAGIRSDDSRSLLRHPSVSQRLTYPPPTKRASGAFMGHSRQLSCTEEIMHEEEGHRVGRERRAQDVREDEREVGEVYVQDEDERDVESDTNVDDSRTSVG
jgi:hypothetical protein